MSSKRIIVADDDVDTVATLSWLLRSQGHEVYEAHDGLRVIEYAGQVQPDIIVLDIAMRRLDGLRTARCIRKMGLHRRPLIVAATGWGGAEDRVASEEAGIDVHLIKPVEVDVLWKLVATPEYGSGQ
jgi:CheY-like chemotaxis protein